MNMVSSDTNCHQPQADNTVFEKVHKKFIDATITVKWYFN